MAAELSTDVPFVVLASAVWDTTNPVNAHQIARRLAARGHRTLFVDSSGLRAPALVGSAHDRRRVLARLARGLRGAREVAPNLFALSPLTLPAGWPEPWRTVSQSLYGSAVRRAARLRLRMSRPIVWAMLPNQRRAALALEPRLLVYHAVDDYAANPGVDAAWVRASEREMLAAAHLVFAASPSLADRLRALRADAELLQNVADVDLFSRALRTQPEPPQLAGRPRPRAVYVGNLAAYRFDFALLREAARALPHVDFVLIGPLGLGEAADAAGPAAALGRERNVLFLGPLPQEALPTVLAHCDVALLPLLENDHTVSCMPLKLWEYLAAGLPVVARDLPNLRGIAPESAIRLYRDAPSFLAALGKSLEGAGREREARSALAAAHGWPARMAEISSRLARALG